MLDLFLNRRSCRSFETNKSRRRKDKYIITSCANLAPSGKNTKPWEFLVVEKKETLQKLKNCRTPMQPFIENAPLAIVVLANKEKTDTWIEDASIASTMIQLEAEKLHLGSCWIQIRMREANTGIDSEEYIRTLFHIPNTMGVLAIIAIGYPSVKKEAHTLEEIDLLKIHKEIY